MPEYSISQLGKFEECALQYKFIYVDGIKRDEEGVEAFLGQRFHDVMEWLGNGKLNSHGRGKQKSHGQGMIS